MATLRTAMSHGRSAWLAVTGLLVGCGLIWLGSGTALARPGHAVLQLKPPPENPGLRLDATIVEKTRAVLEARVQEVDGQVRLDPQHPDRLLLSYPPSSPHPWLWWRDLVTKRGLLEFKEMVVDPRTRQEKWVTRLSGAVVKDAHVTTGERPAIRFILTEQGRQEFARLTTRLVGKPLAIVLDGLWMSAPTVREPITRGEAEIQPFATPEEAALVARVLRSHATPTTVVVLEGADK